MGLDRCGSGRCGSVGLLLAADRTCSGGALCRGCCGYLRPLAMAPPRRDRFDARRGPRIPPHPLATTGLVLRRQRCASVEAAHRRGCRHDHDHRNRRAASLAGWCGPGSIRRRRTGSLVRPRRGRCLGRAHQRIDLPYVRRARSARIARHSRGGRCACRSPQRAWTSHSPPRERRDRRSHPSGHPTHRLSGHDHRTARTPLRRAGALRPISRSVDSARQSCGRIHDG